MNKELFEAVYRESMVGMSEVETKEQLQALLDADIEVEAKHTGPFGEDMGAVVIGFGELKDFRRELFRDGVEDAASEEGYDDVEDWFADNGNSKIIVLDQPIGQSDCNWYTLDAYSVADLDLWASAPQMDKVLHNKEVDVCPNCGGTDFFDQEFNGKMYKGCSNCGAFFPKKD